MGTDTNVLPHPEFLRVIDILQEYGSLLLSERKQTTDREDFGETPRSVADATELGGSARFYSTTVEGVKNELPT